MSVCYRVDPPVPTENLRQAVRDGKLPGISILPCVAPDKGEMLFDGTNYLHFYAGDGTDTGFCRFGGNDPVPILDAIAEHFEVEYLREHDDGFYEDEDEDEDEDGEED
jgi:hypothetical protein